MDGKIHTPLPELYDAAAGYGERLRRGEQEDNPVDVQSVVQAAPECLATAGLPRSRMFKMEDFWQLGGDPWGSGGHMVHLSALGLLWPLCLSFGAWRALWAGVATLALLQGLMHDGPFSA